MQVEVQYFNILSGPLTLTNFSAGGGASWTTPPPTTIGTGAPSHTGAQIPNTGTIYATYQPTGSQAELGFIISGKNDMIEARGESEDAHYSVGTVVSEHSGRFTVAVTFKAK